MDAASQPPAQHEDSHIQIEQESDFDGACTRNLQALEQLPTTMDDMAMMLPMPPSPYITHGHQPRIAHQPNGNAKVHVEECTTSEIVQTTMPDPTQQRVTLVGYPARPLAYPSMYYQGPAQRIEHPDMPPSPFTCQPKHTAPQPVAHFQCKDQKMSRKPANIAQASENAKQKTGKFSQRIDSFELMPPFQDVEVRQSFVRKVLILVLLQLLLIIGTSIGAMYVDSIKVYLQENLWILWTSLGSTLALLIMGSWKYTLLYRCPRNVVFLITLTAAMSTLVASLVIYTDSQALVLAFIMAAVLVLILLLMGMLRKFDINHLGGFLSASLVVLLLTSLLGVFWGCPILQTVVATVFTVVFGVYLVLDLQKLMSSKKKSIGPGDYVFAAINIYLDVINTFLYTLTIITCIGGQVLQ